jgi:hypothetical protein
MTARQFVRFILNFAGGWAAMTAILWIMKVPSGVDWWRVVIAGLLLILLKKLL